MGVQSFNDTASVDGKVAGGGGNSAASPGSGGGSAGGLPGAVQQNSGTENIRATSETKQAAPKSGSASGTNGKPSEVQSFDGASV